MEHTQRVLDMYDEAMIVSCLRLTGSHNVPGGIASTVALADRAAEYGFPAGGTVVDLGHSTGAPARFVARRFGANVVGVDLNPYEEAIAHAAAADEGLARRCHQTLANAEQLPFPDSCFDGAWSQDAMCHMDKSLVIAEAARVVKGGGMFAFTDWIDRGAMTQSDRDQLGELLAMPKLITPGAYVDVLSANGFAIRYLEDRTDALQATQVMPWDSTDWWREYIERFGEAANVWKNGFRRWGELIDEGKSGYATFVAQLA
jgi:sarcosine/dimethylglycine N-methyltransferase